MSAAHFVDLSHEIRAGMSTLPGIPGPVLASHLSREDSRAVYAPGTEFEIGRIEMVANTGTYLDTAFHRYPDGDDLSALPLERIVSIPAEVFHHGDRHERSIGMRVFAGRRIAGCAVLLHTGWDRHFGEAAYADPAPYLDEAAAEFLVAQHVGVVGIDSINIDDMNRAPAAAGPPTACFSQRASRSWSTSRTSTGCRTPARPSRQSRRGSRASEPSRCAPSRRFPERLTAAFPIASHVVVRTTSRPPDRETNPTTSRCLTRRRPRRLCRAHEDT